VAETLFDSYDWGAMAVLLAICLDLLLMCMRCMKSAAVHVASLLKPRCELTIACVSVCISDRYIPTASSLEYYRDIELDVVLRVRKDSGGAECGVIRADPISTLTASRRKEVLALAVARSQMRDSEDPHMSIDMTPLHDFFCRLVYPSLYPSKCLGCGRRDVYLCDCLRYMDWRRITDPRIGAALRVVHSP
jgi:hypothetical protein